MDVPIAAVNHAFYNVIIIIVVCIIIYTTIEFLFLMNHQTENILLSITVVR